jgi:hypothetical protein
MARKWLASHCYMGHSMEDAHVTMTTKGIKRTCRQCRNLRHKKYYELRYRVYKELNLLHK